VSDHAPERVYLLWLSADHFGVGLGATAMPRVWDQRASPSALRGVERLGIGLLRDRSWRPLLLRSACPQVMAVVLDAAYTPGGENGSDR
jgi:hypothetical protein